VFLSQNNTCPPQTKNLGLADTDENGVTMFSNLKPGIYCVGGYYNDKAVTTKGVLKIYLSCEQIEPVFFGIIP
jgi:hypothetical protein